MFRSKTLFIVGAGASCEVGLPSGYQLKSKIAEILNIQYHDLVHSWSGDGKVWEAIKLRQAEISGQRADPSSYRAAAIQIVEAMPQAISIDNYIDAHQGNEKIELCGKLAIVSAILAAERSSELFYNWRNNERFNHSINNAWYIPLFQMLTENLPKSRVSEVFTNVSFITFNYDRCIEHFFLHALQNYYQIDLSEASQVLKSLKVFHPYGSVGKLPWQMPGGAGVEFGADLGSSALLASADQIKTFTEQIEDGDDLRAIRNEVAEAETVVFLGFAFAPQNLDLLYPNRSTNALRVFATAKNISVSDCGVIHNDVRFLLGKERDPLVPAFRDFDMALRSDLTCYQLFYEYWRSMTRPGRT